MIERKGKQFNRGEILTALREQINDREIQPGATLIEQKLSNEFGVSRSVIRGVIADLEA